jgi:EAL domain-containing protein (putative c-di-GMP-specific phosphodiesterase class I)
MGGIRSGADERIAELLRTARDVLGLSVAFLSRLDGTTQHVEVVEPAVPVGSGDAATGLGDAATGSVPPSLHQAVLDGSLPRVVPDVAAAPATAMAMAAAGFPRIRSCVSVPVVLSDGRLYGTLCAAGFAPDPSLRPRDAAFLDVLARAAAAIVEPEVVLRKHQGEIRGRVERLLVDGGPVVFLQPIVALSSGVRVGAEALSRFPADWDGKPPDVCFAEAHDVGLGAALEISALRRAAAELDHVRGYLAMNVSPETMLDPVCVRLLAELPADRIVLELSEHAPVADYPALREALAPLRAAGVRLAIDDVGSGYSSLRHIVMTSPDIIKLDRGLVAGVAQDRVLATLIRALVTFAAGCGAQVVAEGIETVEDAAELADLGVGFGQGWHFGRPLPPEDLAEPVGVPVPPEPQTWVIPEPREQFPQPWAVG